MKIYLVRHGQTANNLLDQAHVLGGDDPLNQTGITQAELAGELLASLDPQIEMIIASPLQRARQTAGILSKKLNLDQKIDSNLRECDFGDWNNHSFTEVAPLYEHLTEADLVEFRPPNGESWRDIAARMVRTINNYHVQNYQSLVLVSHRDPIRFAVAGLLDGPGGAWKNLPETCNNAAIFGLEFLNGQWQLRFANRTI